MKPHTPELWHTIKIFIYAVITSLFIGSSAFATPTDGVFELESNANAVDDSAAGAPDDWGTPPLDGSAQVFSFEDDTATPDTIFTGGKKDIQDIPQLGWKTGTVLDKGDILHAYAAAYIINNELVLTFGADRFGNSGDAFLGFWFYQDSVGTNPDGTFSGQHVAGDLLIQVNYLQSANAGPEILVLEWDTSCKKAASNNPQDGECAAANLRLKVRSNALCAPGNQLVCASTNTSDATSPWPYTPKDGVDDVFPPETFFEGGVNITQLLQADTCFSAFAAETRASSSITAQLKDFVVGDFELCSVDITKTCNQAQVNDTEDGYVYTYSGDVINDGVGTLYDVVVEDLEAGTIHSLGSIPSGQSASYSGSFESTSNGLTNTVRVTAAATPGGQATITDTASDPCESLSLSPMISVNKSCTSGFKQTASGIIAEVSFSGMVCNTTPDLTLVNVSVVDDSGTPSDTADDVVVLSNVVLGPPGSGNECEPYSGSYIPTAFSNSETQSFRDTVTAVGFLKIDGTQATNTASADCDICPAPTD
ncbi:hypothetical protein [Vibrio rotiferianus]|uniref:hypothetical protein n=1 Tax=Vibrio rotiferianus TaxID=190895 RepID=UPI0003A9F4F4|nr:hypothetical protein [Vibrio rotiferianus]PIB12381.1 hypothetical protein B853_22256 [Vibrio rotiferianus CAIM 577 = LMG 21460]